MPSLTMRKGAARGKPMDPVIIKGKHIVKSWWGKAWCENGQGERAGAGSAQGAI